MKPKLSKKPMRHTEATPGDPVDAAENSVTQELKQIYSMGEQDAPAIDMSKLEVVRQPVVRRVLTATLLVLVAIAAGLAGAFLLTNPLRPESAHILTFDIQPEEEVVSGRPTIIRIPYENTA